MSSTAEATRLDRRLVEAYLTQPRLAFWADPDQAYVKPCRDDRGEGEQH